MRFIVTNFAYGTGPYLRTTELAIAVNREREARGRERFGIVVPWVYGERQRRVMAEAFGDYDRSHPGELYLDAALGAILAPVFYDGAVGYAEALRAWTGAFAPASARARERLSGTLELETLGGETRTMANVEYAIELARAPRLCFGVAPVANVTFGYVSEILEHTLAEPPSEIAVDRALVRAAIPIAVSVEREAAWHGLAEPSTFSYLSDREPRYLVEEAIPPTITPPPFDQRPIAEGIYVTITGIPGLERLYREAKAFGLRIYTNDPRAVPGGERQHPRVIANRSIKFQFARAGWGSVWHSLLSGTPLVVPDFDPADDPEICFNNRCIEALGLGAVWRGQPLAEILAEAERLRPGLRQRTAALEQRFGTLDGNAYAARRIVELFAEE